MMKAIAPIIAALVLAGCQSPVMRSAETEHAMCLEQGFQPGSAAYGQCRQLLVQERRQMSHNLLAAGAAISPPARQPLNCHTVYTGTIATTQCY